MVYTYNERCFLSLGILLFFQNSKVEGTTNVGVTSSAQAYQAAIGDYTYTRAFDIDPTRTDFSFTFDLKLCHSGIIVLGTGATAYEKPCHQVLYNYEVSNDFQFAIHKGMRAAAAWDAPATTGDCNSYRRMWLRGDVTDSYVTYRSGTGDVLGSNVLIDFTWLTTKVINFNSVYVASHTHEGHWIFYVPDTLSITNPASIYVAPTTLGPTIPQADTTTQTTEYPSTSNPTTSEFITTTVESTIGRETTQMSTEAHVPTSQKLTTEDITTSATDLSTGRTTEGLNTQAPTSGDVTSEMTTEEQTSLRSTVDVTSEGLTTSTEGLSTQTPTSDDATSEVTTQEITVFHSTGGVTSEGLITNTVGFSTRTPTSGDFTSEITTEEQTSLDSTVDVAGEGLTTSTVGLGTQTPTSDDVINEITTEEQTSLHSTVDVASEGVTTSTERLNIQAPTSGDVTSEVTVGEQTVLHNTVMASEGLTTSTEGVNTQTPASSDVTSEVTTEGQPVLHSTVYIASEWLTTSTGVSNTQTLIYDDVTTERTASTVFGNAADQNTEIVTLGSTFTSETREENSPPTLEGASLTTEIPQHLTSTESNELTYNPDVKCSEPAPIKHGTLEYEAFKEHFAGTVVTYTCDVEHIFEEGGNNRVIVCLNNGKWSAPVSDCEVISCPSADDVMPTWHVAGDVVDITCSEYKLSTNGLLAKTEKCTSLGQWSDDDWTCSDLRCRPPIYLEHAKFGVPSVETGPHAVHCDRGYRLQNGATETMVVCEGHPPSWDENTFPNCKVTRCPPIPEVTQATSNTTDAIFGTVVLYKCLTGYRFSDGNTTHTVECLDTGNWSSDTVPNCEEVVCIGVDMLEYSFGHILNHACSEGLRLLNGKTEVTLVCEENCQWNYTYLDCAAYRCPPVPLVKHAFTDTSNTTYGTAVTYICQEGYALSQNGTDPTIFCVHGIWAGELPVCLVKNCSTPPDIPESSMKTSLPVHKYGTEIVYSCRAGFHFAENVSHQIVTCNSNQTWEYEYDTCLVKNCSGLPEVSHSANDATSLSFGAHVTIACLPGYWFEPESFYVITKCEEDVVWTPVPDKCKEVRCPQPPVWSGILFNTTSISYGTVVNYSCVAGLYFSDSETWKIAECTERGKWERSIVSCEGKLTLLDDSTEEAPGSTTYGIVICSIIGTIIVVVFISDIPTICRDLEFLKTNLHCFLYHINIAKRSPFSKAENAGNGNIYADTLLLHVSTTRRQF